MALLALVLLRPLDWLRVVRDDVAGWIFTCHSDGVRGEIWVDFRGAKRAAGVNLYFLAAAK
jgi:hypothetical protein